MSFLDPAVRLVGRLTFRQKMHATVLVFGAPLIVALGVIVAGLGARVSAVAHERDALAVQLPALALLAETHRYLAASQAWREGAEPLADEVAAGRSRAQQAYAAFAAALDQRGLGTARGDWAKGWRATLDEVAEADADRLSELHSELRTALRGELERINDAAGLLVDGQTSSSRLLDVISAQLPELIDTTGNAARLGAVVLVNQRVKSSRRTELTLLRGNFNALVQWSMDAMQKVAREHPELAASLDDASSRINTAYLGVQEAMTTKMLDTTDFDMLPQAYLALTGGALEQSLQVAGLLVGDIDRLLGARESLLQAQRNAVVAVMLLILLLVAAGFVAAYISIMRGLNDLSAAVSTMASGDLSARVEVSTSDEIGSVGLQFNRMVESLAQRTALLREKTNDIQNMLHHMPQGVLTIVAGGTIHPEYSDYLETIYETRDVRGLAAVDFLFNGGTLGADSRAQLEAAIAACIGEDRMNFDFNSHLLAGEVTRTMPDGRVKHLEFSWSPICNDGDVVEKIMVCVRDVSELRLLEAEAEQQKRELQMIGQILAVSREKFAAFIDSARAFVAQNEQLLEHADGADRQVLDQLFRNMHTIKGNARTYGLTQLTHSVHEAEQAYNDLREKPATGFDRSALLAQLREVAQGIDEYAVLSEVKLGRQVAGADGAAGKRVMVETRQVEAMIGEVEAIDLQHAPASQLADALRRTTAALRQLGSEAVKHSLADVFAALPSLARELGKEPPVLQVIDHGIRIRRLAQAGDLLRDVFMHLYRNAIDHGIESGGERLRKGKPAAGTIRLELALVGERLEMRLSDDGRGLALEAIRRKAAERGLIGEGDALADEVAANLIFAAGFSTASAVTEVSGRGVGMDAVRAFVERAGGDIRLVLTDPHPGAAFRAFATLISLPQSYACLAAGAGDESCEARPMVRMAAEAGGQSPHDELHAGKPAHAGGYWPLSATLARA